MTTPAQPPPIEQASRRLRAARLRAAELLQYACTIAGDEERVKGAWTMHRAAVADVQAAEEEYHLSIRHNVAATTSGMLAGPYTALEREIGGIKARVAEIEEAIKMRGPEGV